MMDQALQPASMRMRHACFVSLIVLAVGTFHAVLTFVVRSSFSSDQYSHILLVVPVSGMLLYMIRRRVLASVKYNAAGGMVLLALLGGSAFSTATHAGNGTASADISVSVLLFVSSCLMAFISCYGFRAFRAALFPLLFLILIVPLPDSVLERIIAMLQNGSAVVTCWLFSAARIPYVRHGVVLALPQIDIFIAEECSGIRSSMVLLLCSLVLGHVYLKSAWSKTLLTLAVIPITVAKNGLRIFVLTTLGMYVDPSFLSGRLHRDGGFIFFALAFAPLFLLIWLFQRTGIEGPAVRPPAAKPLSREKVESSLV